MSYFQRIERTIDSTSALAALQNRIQLAGGVLYPTDYPLDRMGRVQTLRQSSWRKYGQCQQAYRLSQVDNLVPRSSPLWAVTGTLTHELVTALMSKRVVLNEIPFLAEQWRQWYSNNRDAQWSGWDDAQLAEEVELAVEMVHRWAARSLPFDEAIAPVKFRVPLRHPKTMRISPLWDQLGEHDALVTYQGNPWVYELKTTSESNPDVYERQIQQDPQPWGYMAAASELLGRPVGIVYDVLRKVTPKLPPFTVCRKGPCTKHREASGTQRGVADCPSCGGSGVIGLSKTTTTFTADMLQLALDYLQQNSPDGRNWVAENAQAFFETASRFEATSYFRIWLNPIPAYQKAWRSEVWAAAHEIGRKTAALARGRDEWIRMRGNCGGGAGRLPCAYRDICPALSASARDGFEDRLVADQRLEQAKAGSLPAASDEFKSFNLPMLDDDIGF